ncbi:MAG TPA: L,D-transpeptidase family protein [Leptospiraceae bacterium]|nr:L,D-transpeptidase family protein [Leptospiraceae bacterium]HMY66048.1 L,D-transpeptidase family protein [Leptospiraceae bacterium]HNF16949.1 L,D-transpeptidase family protein [Leptospiraceae bacterium]HNF27789.1 L,D-transpeptidase family protein [Leptospiraceae bacterium]HNI25019.1 L,D-transpeptidase family protein [Leptospiraceae bacterium]
MKGRIAFILITFSIFFIIIKYVSIRSIIGKFFSKKSTSDVLNFLEPKVRLKYAKIFSAANLSFPPRKIILTAYKKEKVLELWAKDEDNYKFIYQFEIKKASGKPGPKLREGDLQVPEGIYRILYLNPASQFYLSFKLDYPNDFDRKKAESEGRTSLGDDIFIHGKEASAGCLAMGDDAIEDLFVLVGITGIENVTVFISPNRTFEKDNSVQYPSWTDELYENTYNAIKASLN